jgi:hypothetical protein
MNTQLLKELQEFIAAFSALYAPEMCDESDVYRVHQVCMENGGALFWAGTLHEKISVAIKEQRDLDFSRFEGILRTINK